MEKIMSKAIFWMRRDMRFDDNHALSQATNNFDEVYPVFIFDEKILSKLKNKSDARVNIIYKRLKELSKINKIHIFYGDPVALIPKIAKLMGVSDVFANEDYESYAVKRDKAISKLVQLHLYKDTVVMRFDEVANGKGLPYRDFTAYKNTWLAKLESDYRFKGEYKINKKRIKEVHTAKKLEITSLKDTGFIESEAKISKIKFNVIDDYAEKRDFPALDNTSRASVYLRFGFVSVRSLIRKIMPIDNEGKKIWLSELVWRDFYFSILANFPHAEKNCYRPEFDLIEWSDDKSGFKAWCEGKTGVPIVDAGMRELNTTGFMHNRVRMIVASYLCKTLLIDWRKGEKYFAEKLLDFDLAANNGGWQWSASTGCDASPYFRIFNPYTQGKRFDPDCEYIRKYVTELEGVDSKAIHNADKERVSINYIEPIIDYSKQRIKALAMYKKAKEEYVC
jgi:deoxyribodipyrimidine photo-lyase